MDCMNLTNVIFPAKLETIRAGAFARSGLESVTLPASLRTVSQAAFAKGEHLKKVSFNEGLEVLGENSYPKNRNLYFGVFQESAVEDV